VLVSCAFSKDQSINQSNCYLYQDIPISHAIQSVIPHWLSRFITAECRPKETGWRPKERKSAAAKSGNRNFCFIVYSKFIHILNNYYSFITNVLQVHTGHFNVTVFSTKICHVGFTLFTSRFFVTQNITISCSYNNDGDNSTVWYGMVWYGMV